MKCIGSKKEREKKAGSGSVVVKGSKKVESGIGDAGYTSLAVDKK